MYVLSALTTTLFQRKSQVKLVRGIGNREDRRMSLNKCCGYVGNRGLHAGQYHDADFDWEDLIPEGEATIARQRQAFANNLFTEKPPRNDWEVFHRQHVAARFFKEKRYLPLAFPILMSKPGHGKQLHIAEIGCGCGSALLPILKANESTVATAVDISQTAVDLFQRAAMEAGVAPARIRTFVHDASQTDVDGGSGPLHDLNADIMLCIFTLSAVHTRAGMLQMLRQARNALRPGGYLLFRDYGRYDMAQLRFPGAQLVDPDALVYMRQDGTLSSFFTVEELSQLCEDAGFKVIECEYATTVVRNRKRESALRRVFVHGVFSVPLSLEDG